MFLTQSEADHLITMPKTKIDDRVYSIPLSGEALQIPIKSADSRENFIFDINRRGQIKFSKCTYQSRARTTIILVRLDVAGPPHTNPFAEHVPLKYLEEYNGIEIPTPHLHLFVEGYHDKWAIPAPKDKFTDVNDLIKTSYEFFSYLNVKEHPYLGENLFS